jgi:S1-C subfamily serine protease
MDDILLLEEVESYLRGEMSNEERTLFETNRKKNAELDQLVVEHTYFLQGVETFGSIKTFKNSLTEVEAKLISEGIIGLSPLNGKVKIVYLWKKYKRNIAVAASIAAFISVLASGLIVSFTSKLGNENYRVLVDQINKTNREVNKLKSIDAIEKSGTAKPEVDFRATGFLIDRKGYLVTNAHVISRMKNIYIENKKGEFFKAEALYSDKEVDLAILKITDTAFKAVSSLPYSIKKENSELGEQFFTLGFPRNEIVYGEGYLSAESGSDGDSSAYQLNVSANPGNSGGPVINGKGEIIGIITAKDSKADGVVYAAKSKNIITLLDKLKKSNNKYQVIKTPNKTELKKLDRVHQVKKMEEYVFMVVGN